LTSSEKTGAPQATAVWTARLLKLTGATRSAGVAVGTVLLIAASAFGLSPLRKLDGAAGVYPRTAFARQAASTRLPRAAQGPVSRALGMDDPSYRVVWSGGLALRNPRQHLGVWFGRRGVLIRSGPALLGLSLTGYGYGGALRTVGGAAPRAQANQVSYRRRGLTEWYTNGPLGLEQGFTFAAPPAGRHAGPLTLSLALSGNVRGALAPGADALTFRWAGASLAYRSLVANDARGVQLPAWIELREGGLLLRIDDRRAAYPVQVDPFVQQAKLTASDGAAGNQLGFSVAVHGNTVVAGAPFARENGNALQGAVYVFVKPASGWASETEAAKLTASDGAVFDELGFSVAVSGNTVVAGAPNATVNVNSSQGAAYVFVKPSSGWASETEAARLTASDGAAGDSLGVKVAVSGKTAVVGAVGATVGGHSFQGAAYVFVKPTSGWASETAAAKLTASDGASGDQLGDSVGVSGNTVVAGAAGAAIGGHSGQGAAYVFVRPARGWASETEAAKLTASDGSAGDNLGFSAAVSGNTVVAGADLAAVNGHIHQGAAYVFVKRASSWRSETEAAKLTASDGVADDSLGRSVAVAGNTVVAGADGATVNGQAAQGAAYVFVRPTRGWRSETEAAKLTASDGAGNDRLGRSVALSGSTVVAGAPGATVNGNPQQGATYVFA
jgi:trimeric autotransporter adhesin